MDRRSWTYLLNVRSLVHEVLLVILLALIGLALKQRTARGDLLLPLRIAKVDELMIDPDLLHAALETGQVANLPVFVSLLGGLRGQAAQEHRRAELQIIVGAFIDDGACQASIHAQREVLFDGQQLHGMVLAIGHHFEAVHGGHRIVADVVANANAAIEQLHGQMRILTIVHEDAVLLGAAKDNGDICLGSGA